MCELLLRVVDKVNSDPYADCQLLKAGDLVMVAPDGWGWGTEEYKNPDWRIVKLPNVPISYAQGFLGPEFNADPANPSRMLRRRAFKFNLLNPSIPAAFALWLADSSRSTSSFTSLMTGPQLLTFKVSKTPLVDPNVLG